MYTHTLLDTQLKIFVHGPSDGKIMVINNNEN
jgi:hypothetical protein